MRRNCSDLMLLMPSVWAALKIVNEVFVYHVMQESVRGKIDFKCHKRLNNAKVSINLFLQKIRRNKRYIILIITFIGWSFLALLMDGTCSTKVPNADCNSKIRAKWKEMERKSSGHFRGNYSSTQGGGVGITAGNFSQNPTLSATKAPHFHHVTKLSSRLSTTHEGICRKYSPFIRNVSIWYW